MITLLVCMLEQHSRKQWPAGQDFDSQKVKVYRNNFHDRNSTPG
jgi:hypothetical protein